MSAIAMCTSLVIWYIVDGHPAGVLVFTFVFVFVEFYFLMRYPRFVVVALISIVTQGNFDSPSLFEITAHIPQVLIIGYELEVKKIGKVVSIFPTLK